MIIDSHCHLNRLNLETLERGLDDVVHEAQDKGVEKIISICVAAEELPEIRQLSDKYTNVYHSVGVHPSDWEGEQLTTEKLIELSAYPKCIAIGETGLDYYYNDASTIEAQKDKFRQHIRASIQTQKPLVIHTRAAKQDTLDILQEENAIKTSGVMHCFTEDWEMAKVSMDLGFYISFSGIVTFKNASNLREVAEKMPLDRMLIETDAPYLTPVPKRGKPNYPGYVRYVAEFLAELKNIPFDQLCEQTKKNTEQLFKI